jgi:ribonuclease III
MHPVEHLIQYQFRHSDLLRQALTHRSFSANHNERLEFIGDSVLNCVVADLLYHHYPKEREGSLSRVRAQLVNEQRLFSITEQLTGLAQHLNLGKAEIGNGPIAQPIQISILADAFEAIIGAVFLDGGFTAAHAMIKRLYTPLLNDAMERTLRKDAKTQLQEWLQKRQLERPEYLVIQEDGLSHERLFTVECVISSYSIKTQATGKSRRQAEQHAAHLACLQLDPSLETQLIPLNELP